MPQRILKIGREKRDTSSCGREDGTGVTTSRLLMSAAFTLFLAVMTALLNADRLAPTSALWSDTETVVAVIEIRPPERLSDVDADAPALLSVQPADLHADSVSEVIVEGKNLGEDLTLSMWNEATALAGLQVRKLDDGRFGCTFDLRGVGPGVYNLTAHTASGREASLPACLNVLAPTVPREAPAGKKGRGCGEGGSVTPGKGETAPAAPGGGNITPTEPGDAAPQGTPGQEPAGEVDDGPAPGGIGAFRVTPSTVSAGLSVDLLIEGATFYAGLQARMTRAGSVAWSTSCEILSDTQMRCRFNLAGISPGTYKLEITDYQGQVVYVVGYVKVISSR